MEHLRKFIETERSRFVGRDNNLFAISFGHICRYHEFSCLILERYAAAAAQFLASTKYLNAQWGDWAARGQPLTPSEMKLLEENRRLSAVLHLDIESFYLFSKILLDKIAHSLEFYFGQERGVSLDSHDDLVKNFDRYSKAKDLKVPAGFLELATTLKKDVSDYRDYEIAHEKSPRRLNSTLYDGEGNIRIGASNMYPGEKDQHSESKALQILSADINEFIVRLIDLLARNRVRCRLTEMCRTGTGEGY